MPNWCLNELMLSGPKDLMEELAASGLSLDVLIPCPQELKDTTSPAEKKIAELNKKKYGYPDWYSWQVSNWGTKWDIGPIDGLEAEHCKDDLYEIRVSFDSAWSPPVEAMKKIYERFKDRGLNIWMEYFEPGCCFLGKVTTVDGEFIDECEEYSNSKELEAAVLELDHGMGESEIQYLKEREEEERLEAEAEEAEKAKTNTALAPSKKPATKKPAKKTTVKKSAKKPAVKTTKKPTEKTLKKPAKKAVKVSKKKSTKTK